MVNTLGRYRIVRPLGQGGMGQVYLAADDRLQRQIAIKVLPPHLVSDPERRRRFEREAQTIAALNHPNIVTVHSIEESDGVPLLTMEYVTGSALCTLIPRHGMDVDRLVHIAVPLADAVAAAHAKGIVHGDLKPANVMIEDDGRVKVLDFGLARLAEPALVTFSDSAAEPMGGTAAYMSPEQVEGRPPDHRSDIFALGVVLYELACGERPFKGESPIAVLAAIANAAPHPLGDVNPGVPAELARIVRRCLAKDPERRFQAAKDLRNELQELATGHPLLQPGPAWKHLSPRARVAGLVTAAGIVTIAGITLDRAPQLRDRWSTSEAEPVPVFGQASEVPTSRTEDGFVFNALSLSPDGQWVAYSSGVDEITQDIFLQAVGGQRAFNLTAGSGAANVTPRFSPDGDRIAFRSERDGGGIFVMARTGESVTRLTDFGYSPAWSPDGKRLAVASLEEPDEPRLPPLVHGELWLVSVVTGERSRMPVPDGLQPAWAPDGQFIAYWGRDESDRPRQIFVIRPDGTGRVQITDGTGGDFSPAWSHDGAHLYFLSDRGGGLNLWRVKFDRAAGRAVGRPQAVTLPSGIVAGVSLANAHRIAWVSYDRSTYVQSMAIDARGRAQEPSSTLLRGTTFFWHLDLSPDGSWMVLCAENGGNGGPLFIARSDGSSLRQLTSGRGHYLNPHWSPDGRRIMFSSEDGGGNWSFWSISPDGSHLQKMQLPVIRGVAVWSPDGERLAATDLSEVATMTRVFRYDAGAATVEETLPAMPDPHGFIATAWSPDGTRLAGHRRGGGVAIYSLATRRYEQLTDVGVSPQWFSDGGRLLFIVHSPPKLVVLDLQARKTSTLLKADFLDVISAARLWQDDSRVYFVRSRVPSTIWTAEMK
jgi:serine/threonine protein kinase/Tol biopolymer transport system component